MVFKVTDDIAQQAEVQLGVSDGNRFEVKNGLNSGDLVIIRGNERMRDKQAVKIKKGKPLKLISTSIERQ